MTTALILIIALGACVFAGILGLVVWAISTAHHDHHAMFSGARRRRGHHHAHDSAAGARSAASAGRAS